MPGVRKQKQSREHPSSEGVAVQRAGRDVGWLKRDEVLQESCGPVCLAKMREGDVTLKRREEGVVPQEPGDAECRRRKQPQGERGGPGPEPGGAVSLGAGKRDA